MEYISLSWYDIDSRACDSYQYFLDRGLLLTRKLLNQGFLLVKQSALFFFHLLARMPNLKKNYIYSSKFFHNFHLSESSFTFPGLPASGLAWWLVKLTSPLRKFYCHHHDLVDGYGIDLCHKWPLLCSTCCKYFTVLSSFMIYHWICN
jgi:hypothetical protein